MAIYHSCSPSTLLSLPPRKRHHESRDANVPIYLVPTLLRLTFSQREGNERSRPFTLTLTRLSPGLQFIDVYTIVHTYVYLKRRSISDGRENTYKQRWDTDWQIPATEYTLVNHGPVLAAERRMTRSSSWNSLKFLSRVTRRSCCAASLSHHRRVLRARKLAPPPPGIATQIH